MPLSNLIQASIFGKPLTPSTSPKPCQRCVKLAKKLFSIAKGLHHQFWTIEFEASSYSAICPFCQMLRSALATGDQRRSSSLFPLSLEDRKSGRTYLYMSNATSSMDPARSVISGNKSEGRIERADSTLDISMVRGWMNTCTQEHRSCREIPRTAISGFRLIDCESRELLLAPPDAKYIALSYVWGAGSTAPMFATRLDPVGSLPQTIEDSLYVTVQLGYRYLWIDRYCINQQDPADTLLQCEQMDSIYASSDLTIFATAGDSPDHGLPGVGTSLRCLCAKVAVDDKKTMLAVSEPWHLITESVWNTRGWTYQEGYLSSRRLFFTDAQVFFECQSKAISESESPIWRERSPLSLSSTNADYYFEEDLTKVLPWSIMDCIRRYGSRNLTKQSDILRAFLGILNNFGKGDPPVQYCWGVPLWDPALVFKESRPQAAHLTLSQAFCIGLAFDTKIPSRREGFPSWSWTGWHSEISWHYTNHGPGVESRAVQDISVRIEMESGETMDLAAFQNLCVTQPAIHHQLSHFIHIASWSVPLTVRKVEELSDYLTDHQRAAYADRRALEDAYEGWASERSGHQIRFKLRLRKDTLSEGGSFVGIYVGSMESNSAPPTGVRPILLICRKGEGDCYERVGSVHLEIFDRFDAAGEKVVPPVEESHLLYLPDLAPIWGSFRLG